MERRGVLPQGLQLSERVRVNLRRTYQGGFLLGGQRYPYLHRFEVDRPFPIKLSRPVQPPKETAELLDAVIQYLDVLEEELVGHAGTLANLEAELRKQLREWNQRATQNGAVGALLYDANVVEALEAKVRDRQGDQYSAAQVAKVALQSLGKNLRELQPEEVPSLMAKLVETASNAIGDLSEKGMDDTEFAAHDI